MRNNLRLLGLSASFLLTTLLHAAAAERIVYEVTPIAAKKQFRISMTVAKLTGSKLKFQIPTWSPGAYMIGNYSANIVDVEASTAKGSPLTVRKVDKLTWEVDTSDEEAVRFNYTVNNADIQVANGKPKRAHLSGPRTYMYVVGRKEEPVELKLLLPQDWKIATSLDQSNARNSTDGAYTTFAAPGYDVLADAPIEMGDFSEQTFSVRGVPHRVVFYGEYAHADQAKLVSICKNVAETQAAFFNDVPMKRYVFMFRFSGPEGRGADGLEHLGSTEIGARGPVDDGVRSVTAHEYFHLWNVKRIRPKALGPFDYTQPVRTSNLWWSEGVTSYYGDLLSRRGGLISDEQYFKHLGDTIALLQSNPARLKITADESSYKVWDGGGSQGFGQLSYYTKGELIGLLLDLRMRETTHNLRSLDDVMRSLYVQCEKGRGPGFEEEAIRETLVRIAGRELGDFYDLLCRSTKEMPFTEVLALAGLKAMPTDKSEVQGVTGLFLTPDPEARCLTVRRVSPGGAGAKAGLKSGDKVLTIDGKPSLEQQAYLVRDPKPNATYKLGVERDGFLTDVELIVERVERKVWTVAPDPTATAAQMRLRSKWLNGK